jgi:CRP/FNR family transcriptional regulator, anaerobic regulatory protein
MRGICKPCDSFQVSHGGICAALPEEARAELFQLSRRRTVPAHSVIFRDRDEAEHYFNVTSGIVKLVKTLADGQQHIVGLLYPSDFLGHSPGGRHTYSAESATDVELCAFPRASFDAFMRAHPELQRQILEMTIRELDLCRDWMLLRGRKCSYERVAGFLLMIAERMPPSDSRASSKNSAHFELPFTRAEMADYLGLTLETVSRQFSRLKTTRMIALPSSREIVIPDLVLLSLVARMETCTEDPYGHRHRAIA